MSYTLCLVNSFKNRDTFRTKQQLTLEGMEENPESYYTLQDGDYMSLTLRNLGENKIELLPFSDEIEGEQINIMEYSAFQDVKQKRHGRVFGRTFHWYLEPNEFPFYFAESRNLLLVGAGKDTVDAFLKQMRDDKESGFDAQRFEVDFTLLQPLIPVISGAWVAKMKNQYLKSAGLFGNHVDRSEEFKAAVRSGQISSLMFHYPYQGSDLQIAITKSGSIIFYTRIKNPVNKKPDIQAELTVAIEIYERFLNRKLTTI